MTTPYRLALLFDVDGTLLSTDGAAKEAFSRALEQHFGVLDTLDDIPFGGRTDVLIMGDILHKHGLQLSPHDEGVFWHTVFADMRDALMAPRGRLLPGVPELLDAIEREPGWAMGLLTGNMTEMAKVKLGHFGIHHRFAFGAFGEEAPDRNGIARIAVERAQRRYGVAPSHCIVIGDTEHDIGCARAAGAKAVAVATGARTREVLAAHAPDLLVDDFRDGRPLLAWARGLAAGATGPA
jgi:phosphoglycolate phosphatase-like HAD superfamily hydrolase